MGYSKEEVVELFKEYDETADRDGVRYSIAYFLKEKGLLPLLEVGKWYKLINRNDTMILCYQGEGSSSYGFSSRGVWSNSLGSAWVNSSDCETTELTHEEVETALIAEAKKRYKVGDSFVCLKNGEFSKITQLDKWANIGNSSSVLWNDHVKSESVFNNSKIYSNGKWATIVNTELDELKATYKELGKKIDELENK